MMTRWNGMVGTEYWMKEFDTARGASRFGRSARKEVRYGGQAECAAMGAWNDGADAGRAGSARTGERGRSGGVRQAAGPIGVGGEAESDGHCRGECSLRGGRDRSGSRCGCGAGAVTPARRERIAVVCDDRSRVRTGTAVVARRGAARSRCGYGDRGAGSTGGGRVRRRRVWNGG